MTLARRCFAVLLAVVSLEAFAQFEVGNGGDLIRCNPTSSNAFEGVYTLDYLATYDPNVTYLSPSVEDPLARVAATIERTPLGPEFSIYRADYVAQRATSLPDYFRKNVWKPFHLGFTDLDDSYLYEVLPENCKSAAGVPQLIQTVLHEDRPTAHVYTYDPQALRLVEDRPLQVSMILVHEFLWRVAPNARVLRDANRFLHEESTAQLSASELLVALTNIGLVLNDLTIPRPTYRYSIDTSDVERIDFGSLTVFWEIGFDLYFDNRADDYFQLRLYAPRYLDPSQFDLYRSFDTAPRGSPLGPNYAKLFGRQAGFVTIQRYEYRIVDGLPSLTPIGSEHRILTLDGVQ